MPRKFPSAQFAKSESLSSASTNFHKLQLQHGPNVSAGGLKHWSNIDHSLLLRQTLTICPQALNDLLLLGVSIVTEWRLIAAMSPLLKVFQHP
jgi:hypothetical protein